MKNYILFLLLWIILSTAIFIFVQVIHKFWKVFWCLKNLVISSAIYNKTIDVFEKCLKDHIKNNEDQIIGTMILDDKLFYVSYFSNTNSIYGYKYNYLKVFNSFGELVFKYGANLEREFNNIEDLYNFYTFSDFVLLKTLYKHFKKSGDIPVQLYFKLFNNLHNYNFKEEIKIETENLKNFEGWFTDELVKKNYIRNPITEQ